MTSRMCLPGEVIYDARIAKTAMIYVAKGSVHLLSTVDGESPLLTFGIGTYLGEISLMYSNIINLSKVSNMSS